MIRALRLEAGLIALIACLGAVACQLKRPSTTPNRMIEPQLLEPQLSGPDKQVTKAGDAAPIRLLDTQSRGHIGRPLLHQQPNGELTEDAIWRWSSAPERYLDTALHLEGASSPSVLLVETGSATTLAATLLVWDLESSGGTRLAGAVEFQVTGPDRVVRTQLVKDSEPVSAELPGNLAEASGHLLRRLAVEGIKLAANPPAMPTTSKR
jgi:hypothetical protein